YDVTGVMLKLWKGEAANNNSGCCNVGAAEDARRVADVIGIPFYVLNFADKFGDTVVRDFHEAYASGQTPNPCVRCNQWVKFGALMERAKSLGADVLATGHYARVRNDNGRYRLLRGADADKDQSYVLWMLSQQELAHTTLPIGELEKSETRRIATELGLRTAAKPDSQEICFVKGGDVGTYVDTNIPQGSTPGPIVDREGHVVGEHRGIAHYTVGQRRGLGISLGAPVFVSDIDASKNELVVGERNELDVGAFVTQESSFVGGAPSKGVRLLVQHRAHGDSYPALIRTIEGATCTVDFEGPVEAVAPGQSAAFYSAETPDEVVGGGIIASTVPALAGV
ncbi:MAG: tRNA 2-thiouridine(34) synthase MnmA, partial [Actinobacteria bacterium]|nr:tRNA 2-thiouridine(34) synthase MnmA [Actinomycetota bacterium]